MAPLIEIDKAEVQVSPVDPPILGPISLVVEAGECIAIVGPSGSGKSTLLNLVGGLQFATSGRVVVGGQELKDLSDSELSLYRSQKIGFVFQSFHLHPSRTVLQNLLLPLYFSNTPLSAGRPRALDLLAELSLADFIDKPVHQLSGGQRQRVALARACMNQPSILLADEPAGHLDEENAHAVLLMLQRKKKEENLTLCLVTHHPTLLPVADRILHLQDGRLVEGHQMAHLGMAARPVSPSRGTEGGVT